MGEEKKEENGDTSTLTRWKHGRRTSGLRNMIKSTCGTLWVLRFLEEEKKSAKQKMHTPWEIRARLLALRRLYAIAIELSRLDTGARV